jgi:hypothetical protein
LAADVQVGTYTGSGIGLYSSGDGVIVFDARGIEVWRVSFGAATAGSSFYWGYDIAGNFDPMYVGAANVGLVSVLGTIQSQVTVNSADVAMNVGSPRTSIQPVNPVLGCMDATACNYNPDATDADDCDYAAAGYGCDGNCLADTDNDGVCDLFEVEGCQDAAACNYNASATDAGDCTYAVEGYDCAGNCLADVDGWCLRSVRSGGLSGCLSMQLRCSSNRCRCM